MADDRYSENCTSKLLVAGRIRPFGSERPERPKGFVEGTRVADRGCVERCARGLQSCNARSSCGREKAECARRELECFGGCR